MALRPGDRGRRELKCSFGAFATGPPRSGVDDGKAVLVLDFAGEGDLRKHGRTSGDGLVSKYLLWLRKPVAVY